jgi:peptide/nickel transport system substrate-binding protein
VSAQPKTGGILRYPIPTAPAGFDSHVRPTAGPVFSSAVFSQLVKFDPTKRDMAPQNIIGDLVEKWEFSVDGKTLTFSLRQNVKWHDGNPFSADDVVYSIEKMMDSKRSTINGNFPAYDRVEKVDANTVKLHLKQPSPGLLMQLASVYSVIEPKHLAGVDSKTGAFLVGTGPFMFKNYVSGVSGELVKNPNYFIKGYPYLDGISINIMTDRSAQMDALITGRLDILCPYGGLFSQEHLERIQNMKKDAVIEVARPPQATFFWLNTQVEQLKDARVRKAIGLMIDQKALVMAGYGSEAWLVPDRAIFSTTYGLANQEINKLFGWDKPWDTRVAEAKKLLADAGYASGFKLVLLTSKIAEYERIYTLLADTLKKNLNIDCEIVSIETSQAWARRDSGQFGVWIQEIIASTGDPDEVLPYFGTNKPANYIKYSNPKVDELFAQQTVTMNTDQRVQMTQQIERAILTDMPIVTLRGSIMRVAWAPYVKGFVLPNAGYGPHITMERVWLDK